MTRGRVGYSTLAAELRRSDVAFVGKNLSREDVVGTSLAHVAFDIVDAVWLQDERIAEIVGKH